jgi:hypothetical protein
MTGVLSLARAVYPTMKPIAERRPLTLAIANHASGVMRADNAEGSYFIRNLRSGGGAPD